MHGNFKDMHSGAVGRRFESCSAQQIMRGGEVVNAMESYVSLDIDYAAMFGQ